MSSAYERCVVLGMFLFVAISIAVAIERQRALPAPPSTVRHECVWSRVRSMLPLLHAKNGGQAPDLHAMESVRHGGSRFLR